VDLRHGIVKGYSRHVAFVVSPLPTDDDRCTAQSVLGVELGDRGPFNRARLTLDYSEPRLWTVDVSDSRHADGYGISHATADDDDDNNAVVSNSTQRQGTMAETHVRAFYRISNIAVSDCMISYSDLSARLLLNISPLIRRLSSSVTDVVVTSFIA